MNHETHEKHERGFRLLFRVVRVFRGRRRCSDRHILS